tara:strand:- start:1928 stop:2863 length:936 start_codon:yes stop_codon:yes gene_type:complete
VISKNIKLAKKNLDSGNLIGLPTETVYGLAGNALDPEVILNIYEVKKRPFFNPLIAHIGKKDQINKLCINIPDAAHILIDEFWPGPLTLILEKSEIVPDLLTSGSNKIAVRLPSHPMAIELLQSLKYPLAAPSANPFQYVSPTCAQHVIDQLGESISFVLDGGQCSIGIESTIIGFNNNKVEVYRLGGIPVKPIERVLKTKTKPKFMDKKLTFPGQGKKHYAPQKKIFCISHGESFTKGKSKSVFVSWKPDSKSFYSLSLDGSTRSGASRLFSILRKLDTTEYEEIYIEKAPNEGLGAAINDRLMRASHPS